jgi:hypothetical protein
MARILLGLLIATNVLTFVGLSHGELALGRLDIGDARLGHLVAWSYVVVGWWLLTAVVLLWTARVRDRRGATEGGGQPYGERVTDQQFWVIGTILVVAFIFRSAELDRLAWGYAGVHPDGAYNSEVAFRLLDGSQPFSAVLPSVVYARDCLTLYYLAAFHGLFGRTIETLRLACNVLGLFNCFLLFLVMRQYTQSAFAIAATVAAYGFSGVDTVFAMSGMEYIMTTPFLLGSFVLFQRTVRRGKFMDAVLAGFIWGLGFSSHYPYMFLGFVVPAIAIVNFRVVRPWLSTFAVAGLLGALPKVSYLILHHADYFQRFHEVARHDSAGRFLVPGYFSASLRGLTGLLFTSQIYAKSLLPEDPIIPPWQLPFVVVGLAVALLRPRRPEHGLALLVVLLTVAVSLAAYVQDYRVMNAMPVIFLLFGIGLATIEKVLKGRAGRALLGVVVGGGVVHGMAGYFSHDDNAAIRDVYGTQEVALARSIKRLGTGDGVYVLAPRLTYRLKFLNLDRPTIEEPNDGLIFESQQQFSRQALATVMGNIWRVLVSESARKVPVRFIISAASPYGDTVRQFLMSAPGARVTSWQVKDPVSHESMPYYLVSVEEVSQAVKKWQSGAIALPKKMVDEAQLRRGTLALTTFAGPEQLLPVEEREVPAVIDFDFRNSVPYPGEWRSDFSLRWSGYLLANTPGEYRIKATFDDGCRVFVDDHVVFADWSPGGARTASAAVNLDAGWHPIRIDYFQLVNEARLLFEVWPEGERTVPLPATDFASDSNAGALSGKQHQQVPEVH